jgi:hypothetical protein
VGYFGRGGVVAATEQVEISGGYHVTIGLLSGKEAAECEAILQAGKKPATKVTARGKAGSDKADTEQVTEMTLEYAAFRDARLVRGIKGWDLDGEDGQVVPVNLQNIQAMPEKDRNLIFVALEKFNRPLDEDEQGN